jgi:hypothetical protein
MLTVHAPTAQGFYFSRPIHELQFAQLVRALPEYTAGIKTARVVPLFR